MVKQRVNEPDSDYENRKKRISRQMMGGQGLMYGKNRCINGTFDTDLSGWATYRTATWVNGKAFIDGVTANNTSTIHQGGSPALENFKTYLIEFYASDVVGTDTRFTTNNITVIEPVKNGLNRAVFTTNDKKVGYKIYFQADSGSSMYVDDVVVRAIL